MKWYYYLVLGLVDVEANYLVVKAYQYTSLTSVMLLDCWAIPAVIFLTWMFLKTKYRLRKYSGVAICVAGLVLVVFSDVHAGDRAGGTSPVKGDILVIAGATLYAISNVSEEFLVKASDQSELIGMLGLFGALISVCQISIFERSEIKSIHWNVGALKFSSLLLISTTPEAKMRMLRWICGHTRRDRIRNDDIRERVGVAPIEEKLMQHRLRWFGHVKRRPEEAPVRAGIIKRPENVKRGRGRPTLTWAESVKRDLKEWNIAEELATDRKEWKRAIHISGSTMLNLSLLTSDMWAILIRVFAYHEKVDWMYYVAFAAVAVGLVIYSGDSNNDDRSGQVAEAGDVEGELNHGARADAQSVNRKFEDGNGPYYALNNEEREVQAELRISRE